MDIRHYLHYYLGQECAIQLKHGLFLTKIIGIHENGNVQTAKASESQDYWNAEYIKPILTRLSDMQDDHLISLVHMILDSPKLEDDSRITKEEIALETGESPNEPRLITNISCRCFNGRLEICDQTGDLFLFDEDDSKCDIEFQAEIVMWLIKQGFDLFGLIDAELAIDKTTLK